MEIILIEIPMIDLFANTFNMVEIFARGGGGGSSSGGGGGSSGGGGGGIAVIGYIPMHVIGAFIRKKMVNKPYWWLGQAIGWFVCTVFCFLCILLGSIGFLIALGAIFGTTAGLYSVFSKIKRNKKVTQKLYVAAEHDVTWDEQAILMRTTRIFEAYQEDWTTKNWQNMKNYMTPMYYQHASLLIAALTQMNRTNTVQYPTIREIAIVDLADDADNTKDTVTVGITAEANDMLYDDLTNEQLYQDKSQFTEYWTLKRHENTWYLDKIEQATQARWKTDSRLEELAQTNGFFYSLDMGWLFIPKRGELFGKAKFGVSDINNHIIGVYNNNYLLQLYTYDPVPRSSGSYLIAQTNVPKQYGNIVVRRKSWKNFFKPKGLRQISMEWGDFNKKYDVFASSIEGATSFELLHPAFMEKLEALPFEVNIEVVDNVVYLYSAQLTEKNPPASYYKMLEILQEAYKQMRM